MRRMIIDTDCGSDDAVALIMALKSDNIVVEAITTVGGNVPLAYATKNALMTVEITDSQKPPVYAGASKPLMKDLITAVNVHGEDGMGDCDIIHPKTSHEQEYAVDAILRIIREHPYQVEIVALGPVTNIALAMIQDKETMSKVKHIYSMGTAGFGRGNTTPVSEFNVYVDAEAYSIMLNAGIPLTIIGFDVCLGDAALNKADMDLLLASGIKEAEFAVKCNKSLLDYNLKSRQEYMMDLPDAVAMGVALWKDIMKEALPCYCYTCCHEPKAYGQVIIDDGSILAVSGGFEDYAPNALVCKTIDSKLFKNKMIDLLVKQMKI